MFHSLFPTSWRLAAIVAFCLSLVSCYRVESVPSAFWNEKGARIAVAVDLHDKQARYNLRDAAGPHPVDHPVGLVGALAGVKPDSFRALKGRFASELRKRGFRNVVEVKGDIHWKDFPRRSGGDLGTGGRDYSSLLASQNADYLIVLSQRGYGVTQRYFGGGGIAAPWGSADSGGIMVKKGVAQPVWYTGPLAGLQATEVDEGWDRPNYSAATKAAREALALSAQFLYDEFFGYESSDEE